MHSLRSRTPCSTPTLLAVGVAMLCATSLQAVAAPSFECTGNLTQTETVICSDDGLSQLDVRMVGLYKRALAVADRQGRAGLINDQKAFLEFRDNCAFDKQCIRQIYLDQIKTIEAQILAARQPAQDEEIEEKTVLGHNGSTITMTKKGNQVEMRYSSVRQGLPVNEGDLLFNGTEDDAGRIRGTAFTFRQGCLAAGYQMSGQQSYNKIVLKGASPVRKAGACTITGSDASAPSANLVFDIAE